MTAWVPSTNHWSHDYIQNTHTKIDRFLPFNITTRGDWVTHGAQVCGHWSMTVSSESQSHIHQRWGGLNLKRGRELSSTNCHTITWPSPAVTALWLTIHDRREASQVRGLDLGVVLLVMLSGQAFPSGGGGAAVSTAGSGGDRQAVPRPVKRDVLQTDTQTLQLLQPSTHHWYQIIMRMTCFMLLWIDECVSFNSYFFNRMILKITFKINCKRAVSLNCKH